MLSGEKDSLILSCLGQVRFVVLRRYRRRCPDALELQDLVSAGYEGLVRAARDFSKERGVQFRSYAEHRIRGAILDELRRFDVLTRRQRELVDRLEKAAERAQETSLEEAAVQDGLRGKKKSVALWGLRVSLCGFDSPTKLLLRDGKPAQLSDVLLGPTEKDPAAKLEGLDLQRLLFAALKKLPGKERQILQTYYFDGLSMREAGKALGVTQSRASQLHSKALGRLRRQFRRAGC